MLSALFAILIFPGILFLSTLGMYAEYLDRKICAILQNRVGPPWFQPLADFIKLAAKTDVIPKDANPMMFHVAPLFAVTSAVTAILYIPIWGTAAVFSFTGDAIVVLYLLTIPTLAFFIGGWYSSSLFARIGSVRAVTQLFSYEVPLFMAVLTSALLSDSWSLTKIAIFYSAHPWLWLINLIGFGVALVALLGKLEKGPFDIPEAETEIVAGSFTEYSGRFLAMLRMALDIEMVVGAALLTAVFLPFGLDKGPIVGFILFIIKVFVIVSLLSLSRTIVARLRIDQMIDFCWRYLVPLSLIQLLINFIVKGVMVL
jgi:NADH-quinone oxidoreductase subunit H